MANSDSNLDREGNKVSLASLFPQSTEAEAVEGPDTSAERVVKRGRPKGSSKKNQPTGTDAASTSKPPAKRGRPKSSLKKEQTTEDNIALGANDTGLPAHTATTDGTIAEQHQIDTNNTEATTPKKRGRPRKAIPGADSALAETPATPKRRGRPRKTSSPAKHALSPPLAQLGGTQLSAVVPDHNLATPKKRGRPSKAVAATVQSPSTNSADADEQAQSKEPARAVALQDALHATDTTEHPQKKAKSQTKRPAMPKKSAQPKRSGKIQTLLFSQTAQKPQRATSSKQKSAKAKSNDDDDDDDEFIAASSEEDDEFIPDADISPTAAATETKPKLSKYKRKLEMSPAIGKKDSYWSGPSEDQRLINPAYIDFGLDEAVWSDLQSIRIKSPLMAAETAADVVLKHLPQLADSSSDIITLTMYSGKEPSDTDPELQLKPLNAHELSEDRAGFIANVGEHIPAIDWRPVLPSTNSEFIDYIATSSLGPKTAGSASLGVALSKRVKEPGPGSILIWRLITAKDQRSQCQMDMALLHRFGHCLAIKWCPLSIPTSALEPSEWPVIGILAAIFGDGHLRVLAVPEPDAVRRNHQSALAVPGADPACQPAFVHWLPENSLVDIKAPHGVFTSLDWVCSDVVVAGTSRGNLMAWDIKGAIQTQFNNSQIIAKGSWPYSISGLTSQQSTLHAKLQQPIPIINHLLHNGDVHSISVFCSGSALDAKFDTYRSARGFLCVGISDLQVLTLGMDGRYRQIVLQTPVRQNAAIEFPSRRVPAGICYWIYGTCVYSELDKFLRMHHERIMSASYNPWIRSTAKAGRFVDFREEAVMPSSGSHGVPEDAHLTWNLSQDRPSLFVNKLGCPTLDMAASDMHPYVAVAKNDGELMIANLCIAKGRRVPTPHSRVIYTLQCYNNMTTQQQQQDAEDGDDEVVKYAYRARSCIEKRPSGGPKLSWQYNLYMPQVSVLKCAWSRNPNSFSWIASSNANGILRIEDVAP
ncbi:hypothetical protein IWW36_002378 [Coemansia brasiliensis]|uniref:Uncharacterized protein n=1 Tax=Coemansia brasiliensis TaxID=2650707 RepID=A0A9W8I773_9FUNG|nr:hypothetical protein IWW36_002378 [Coemansia brasiliensis]